MKNNNGDKSIEVSTEEDIVVKSGGITRIRIGRIDPVGDPENYGMQVKNDDGDLIF